MLEDRRELIDLLEPPFPPIEGLARIFCELIQHDPSPEPEPEEELEPPPPNQEQGRVNGGPCFNYP